MTTDNFEVLDSGSGAGQGKDDREVTTTTPYLKVPCIGSIRNLVSFSLRDNRNEGRQDFEVWDSRKIKSLCIRLTRKSVSFYSRDNHNES